MATERWGTFSVIDHKNAAALVPEVLMYDRLVLPYPGDTAERERWQQEGWEPDLLDDRVEALGPLAIKANWDNDAQRDYQQWMEKLSKVEFDKRNILEERQNPTPFDMTRFVLALQPRDLPDGVLDITQVAAYPSEMDLKAHFQLEMAPDERERDKLGYLMAHRLAIPDDRDPEKALAAAIKLSKENKKFRENRQALYRWQEEVLIKHVPVERAVNTMDMMVREYNEAVEAAVGKVYYKFAFTLAAIGLSLAGAGLFNPLVTGSALLALVKFAKFDSTPAVEAGVNAPAAMFHDVEASYKRFRLA